MPISTVSQPLKDANGMSGLRSYCDEGLENREGITGKGVDLASPWAFARADTLASSPESGTAYHTPASLRMLVAS